MKNNSMQFSVDRVIVEHEPSAVNVFVSGLDYDEVLREIPPSDIIDFIREEYHWEYTEAMKDDKED